MASEELRDPLRTAGPLLPLCLRRSRGEEHREGPSTQYSRALVPKAIEGMVFGARVFKDWVLGLSGTNSPSSYDLGLKAPLW